MRQYKRISTKPKAKVPCPICKHLVFPRGMGGHMRLSHVGKVPENVIKTKQLEQKLLDAKDIQAIIEQALRFSQTITRYKL
jgi:hypothetical protein